MTKVAINLVYFDNKNTELSPSNRNCSQFKGHFTILKSPQGF